MTFKIESKLSLLKKILISFLLILLLIDFGYSFLQYYYTPFDGDMPENIVPPDNIKKVLESPLGFKAIEEHSIYTNPNRFFCHWSFYQYFNTVPLLLQHFTTPIRSAYLSCALAKVAMQFLLTLLLAFAISGGFKFNFKLLLSSVLITPLFQVNGYFRHVIGIIDPAPTYDFFYALPMIILLLYFTPFFFKFFYGIEYKKFKYIKILWIPLALVSSLSGALNTGIALVATFLLVIQNMGKSLHYSTETRFFGKIRFAFKNMPKDYYYYLLPISLFSLYSLFLGRYNLNTVSNEMPLSVLYPRLMEGIYRFFIQNPAYPILFAVLIVNTVLINLKFKNKEGKKIINAFKWIGFFSILYLLLLPLGGYRECRPYIIRYDTILPITMCFLFIFGKTTLFILQNLSYKQMIGYIPLILAFLLLYTYTDKPEFHREAYEYEKAAIMKIAQSPDYIVQVDDYFTILSWTVIRDPAESALKTKLLKKWNILKEDKLFYQKTTIEKQ